MVHAINIPELSGNKKYSKDSKVAGPAYPGLISPSISRRASRRSGAERGVQVAGTMNRNVPTVRLTPAVGVDCPDADSEDKIWSSSPLYLSKLALLLTIKENSNSLPWARTLTVQPLPPLLLFTSSRTADHLFTSTCE